MPSSWLISNEEINVFETSTDPAVKTGIKILQQDSEFVEEISSLLKEYNLNNLLSLAILKRDFLQSNDIDNEMYLEFNDESLDKSIVQLCNKNNISAEIIRTSWSFGEPRQHRCLNQGCFKIQSGMHGRRHIPV